ncbi:hypothetical protein BDW62DRAFT_205403 [Aspergillus aurantiobrunneus]
MSDIQSDAINSVNTLNNLALEKRLDLYLSPLKNTRNLPTYHWVLILAPQDHGDCTFYHVLKRKFGFECSYHNTHIRRNQPLHSEPISTGFATLNRVGTVPMSMYDNILHFASMALLFSGDETPWTATFLEFLEEGEWVAEGMSAYYQRHCELVSAAEIEDMLEDLGLDNKVSIKDLMKDMDLER